MTMETIGLLDGRRQARRNAWKVSALGVAVGVCFVLGIMVSTHRNNDNVNRVKTLSNVCEDVRFLTIEQLNECVGMFPFNASERDAAITHLRAIMPSYAFKELALKEHEFGPYVIPAVDIDAQLNVIANTTYKNDAEMQTALYNVFKHLRDAHTAYMKPVFYSSFYAFHPVSLKSFARDNVQVIQMDLPDHTEVKIYETYYPDEQVDIDILGWDITHINDQPAFDVLREFANKEIGLLKDEGTRFNMAVTGFETGRGWFVFRPLSSFDIPKEDAVTYTLTHPETNATKQVSYKWLGLNGAAFPGRTPPTSSKHKLEHLFQRLRRHLGHHNFIEERPTVDFQWLNEQVGVLSITQFSPSGDEDGNAWTEWFGANITTALANFTVEGGKKLIIDLRGNGGGDICLGYATIRYLFPSWDPNGPREGVGPHNEAVYHLKRTPLFELLAQEGLHLSRTSPNKAHSEWVPNQWFSSESKRQFTDASWMLTNNTHPTLGDVTESVYYGCSSYDTLFQAPGTSFPGLPKEDVLLVSHGYCGSTCSVFSSFIQMHDLAQTVAFGGFLNTPQQFFSFPGGQVYNSVAVYVDAYNMGLESNQLVPEPLATGAAFSFAMVAISPWKTPNATLPLEYHFVPATFYPLFPENPLDSEALFNAALDAAKENLEMGGLLSKKKESPNDVLAARRAANVAKAKNQVSDKDKAVLELKASRDRLKKYQKQLEKDSEALQNKARELIANKHKDRALLCLKMRKFKLQQLEQADNHLMNVHTMIDSVEWESQQLQIFQGLKAGNAVLDAIHKEMTVEAVEDLMLETQEAQAHADEISRILGGALSTQDEDAVLAELAEIEAAEAAELETQLPIAPDAFKLVSKQRLMKYLTPSPFTCDVFSRTESIKEKSLYGHLCMKPNTRIAGPAVHLVKIEWLKPHEAIVSREKIESLLAATLSWGGYLEPLLVDRQTGAILDGHHRYTVGLELQLQQLPAILVDYMDDSSITVQVWPGSRLSSMSKYDVLLMALSAHTFPPKSSKHAYPFSLGTITIPLLQLESNPKYHGAYSPAPVARHYV
ncbi:hydroxymethylglutaryl-CoA lyase, mitochondrial precursor [Thraustotheca clavata]|uniref:Hydroxymethylglutaryl-CoA lyase, mitochondrial n=1 Tax=Thraustotheca clavata TaxID=74557 RepID=A0A1V9ZMW9_9STRA|nr:hydroxymethylglutaryl-CoA lyase, mitochondrial precursor [Thraustotheca clavata]